MSIDLKNLIIDEYRDVSASKMLGIFGHPIKHTLSPVIHDNLSEMLGLDERYVPFHVEPEMNLGECVRAAFEEDILGLNITVPYKQEVMQYLVEIDDAARAIGAVNTLVRVKDGFKGYNTDMPGLARAIESEGINLNNKKVIMLGAGGAARAVAYMCLNYGVARVFVLNRTYDNAKVIAEDMNECFNCDKVEAVAACDYKDIPNDKYIFIQCTSVGLHEGDGLPLIDDVNLYEMAECGIDLIYNPAETPFIKLLREKSIKCFNGLKMLLYQGIMAYELWNKIKITDEISEKVYEKLYEAVYGGKLNKTNNIVLIGYMGAGKTTVGKYIAGKYGYRFIDTDEYIVEKTGMSINEIFATKGEDFFRRLETSVLEELKGKLSGCVISTGGGLPLRSENAVLLKKIGKVYYLKADADTIYERVKDSTDRPLLSCDNPYKRISDMLLERNPKYESAADIIIDTVDITLEDITKYMEL